MSAALLRLAGNARAAMEAAEDEAIATVDGALEQLEAGATRQFDKAHDYLKQLPPPLAKYAREQLGQVEGAWEGVTDVVDGVWGLAKMAYSLDRQITHAVTYAISNPAEAGAAIQASAQRGWTAATTAENWRQAGEVASHYTPDALLTQGSTWASDPATARGPGAPPKPPTPRPAPTWPTRAIGAGSKGGWLSRCCWPCSRAARLRPARWARRPNWPMP